MIKIKDWLLIFFVSNWFLIFSKERMKTDEKYSKKSLKVKQKVEKAALLGLFCESKKLVGK